MNQFPIEIIKKLKYYVYALTYKENGKDKIFYIGKGKGNRVFHHLQNCYREKETDKNSILRNKEHIDHWILNAGLTNDESIQIEGTLINVMKKFAPNLLTNIKSGSRSKIMKANSMAYEKTFTIEKAQSVSGRYSEPINLTKFCIKHNLKILLLKSMKESYNSAYDKDFRGVLEGIWKATPERMEGVDYVVSTIKGEIYSIYKYVKGSAKRINTLTRKEWEKWNYDHAKMGRPEFLVEQDLHGMDYTQSRKTIFELKHIYSRQSKKSEVENYPKELKKLLDRVVGERKVKGQSAIVYFNC